MSLTITYIQFTNKHLVSLFHLYFKSLPIDDSDYLGVSQNHRGKIMNIG